MVREIIAPINTFAARYLVYLAIKKYIKKEGVYDGFIC